MRKPVRVETVEFNGRVYRRYPDSKHRSSRVYFHNARELRWLHRDIWEHTNGPIPSGHHVHHKDGNPLNNSPDNLECITAAQHIREHADDERRAHTTRMLLERAVPKAAEWHRSEAGRAWHRENGKRAYANRTPLPCTCEVCGGSFASKVEGTRICSAKCHARKRRASGLDDITLTCPCCSREFRRNKYDRPGCCSLSCAKRYGDQRKRAGVQPHGGV